MEFITTFQQTPIKDRLSKIQSIKTKHPNTIPVIIDRANTSTPKIPQNRFLIPKDKNMTIAKLMYVIRKKIPQLKPEQAIFMFVHPKNIFPTQSQSIAELYHQHQNPDDQFLYIVFSVESTFGAN